MRKLSISFGIFLRGPWWLLLLLSSLALAGCGELFFRRNPGLSLLDPGMSGEAANPTWTPDGRTLYFTAADYSIEGGGQLRAIRSDGTGGRLVLDGKYGSCCISPDGTKLALVVATSRNKAIGGALLWLDTLGHILDTLSPPEDTVSCVRFGDSNDTLYYLVDDSIFRLELSSGVREAVVTGNFGYKQDFDVSGDSLIALPGAVYHFRNGRTVSMPTLLQPRFCPKDPTLVLGVMSTLEPYLDDLVLVNLISGSVTHLDARPYYSSDIIDPVWFPDGGKMVFSSANLISAGFGGGQTTGTYRLWVLER